MVFQTGKKSPRFLLFLRGRFHLPFFLVLGDFFQALLPVKLFHHFFPFLEEKNDVGEKTRRTSGNIKRVGTDSPISAPSLVGIKGGRTSGRGWAEGVGLVMCGQNIGARVERDVCGKS